MLISDKIVLSRLKKGSREVYAQLFHKHYKNLVLYAQKFVMDTEVARDLAQDVFIFLWEKRETLHIERSLDAYLFRAVHNSAINYLKRESNKTQYIKKFILSFNEQKRYAHASANAHEQLVFKDLSEKIETVVESLPEQCRNIFKMSRFKGMKNKEIAEIYNISPRTVETQIYRALKVLKENLVPFMV